MKGKVLAGVTWWPHSGGRWLSRSILKKNPAVIEMALVHPWIFNSSDVMLDMDITAQVHKARSLPELKDHLNALKKSTDYGRIQGLKFYFEEIVNTYFKNYKEKSHIVGEMCMGSPIPKYFDVEAVYKSFPDFKLIHLVRNPVDSFKSFTTRHELDDDPVKVAGSWLALNSKVRTFFEEHKELQSQCLIVRYEDLLSTTEKEVKRICEFLELPYTDSMIAETKERWGKGTKVEISDKDKKLIEEVAFSELKKYKYL